jgi:hypothetical protein
MQLLRQSKRATMLIRSEVVQCGLGTFATLPAFTGVPDPCGASQIFTALKAPTLQQQSKVS